MTRATCQDLRRWTALILLLSLSTLMPAAPRDTPPPPADDTEDAASEAQPLKPDVEGAPMQAGPPVIQAPRLPDPPQAGKGRLQMDFTGDRRWCTYPDDRVVRPPEGKESAGAPKVRNPIYTYGYQFTIAAVARSRPTTTLLLFESPIIRTALLREAAKLGKGGKKPPSAPVIGYDSPQKAAPLYHETPSSIVPYWQELSRCTTLPEQFEFDLEPGTYDVYAAFDILGRSGSWAHRTIGFETDIEVLPDRTTRVVGSVKMFAGNRREIDLQGSTLLPAAEAAPGAP
jgi:hypothetical protein